MTRARMLVLGGLLIVIVGLLASGLAGIEFRGGRRGPEPAEIPRGAPGGAFPFGAPEWLLDAILITFLILLVVRILTSRSPGGRGSPLLQTVVILLAVAGAIYLLTLRFERPPAIEEPGAAATMADPAMPTLGEGEPGEEGEPPAVPGWAVYLAAGILGAVLALWFVRKFMARPPSQAKEIREAMASASADLAHGLPVSDVVIRCWLRMVEVLSRHVSGADAPAMTPREFADRLVRLGFREDAVLVLTNLFEEVRYGHKETEPRRAEAMAALAAIERAYG